jgi:hypothetical protein
MQDLIYIVVTIIFFVVSIAYVHFCERVKSGELYEFGIGHHAHRERPDDGLSDLRIVASGEVLT